MNRAQIFDTSDTIVALATPPGVGAIGVVRLSGVKAFDLAGSVVRKKNFRELPSHTVHFASIYDGNRRLDEAVFTIFKGPRSFTCEDVVEISVHGSPYILEELIQLLLRLGARLARPGEFTFRAFINGRFDLSQAEAVADLIAADNEHAHRVAMNQMRGGFTLEIGRLRTQLVDFASLLELELDFSEEDVEFANRKELIALLEQLIAVIGHLQASFRLGNVMKNGVATVIAGRPNAGKSTLLNALLNEEKAIVSHIPGTTRDVIEDVVTLDGVKFRFFDTAGIREAEDQIEAIGVARTLAKMEQAAIILYLFDLQQTSPSDLKAELSQMKKHNAEVLLVGNKLDAVSTSYLEAFADFENLYFISAKESTGLKDLENELLNRVYAGQLQDETVVANARHVEALSKAKLALEAAVNAFGNQLPTDLVAQEIRLALHYLGEITGEVTTDDLLGNIFSKFCIGK